MTDHYKATVNPMALAKKTPLVNHAAGADLSVAEEVATMLDVESSGYPG